MKIRMLHALSGPTISLVTGDVTDQFDDAEAQRLIDAGFAEAVTDAEPTPATPPAPAKPGRR